MATVCSVFSLLWLVAFHCFAYQSASAFDRERVTRLSYGNLFKPSPFGGVERVDYDPRLYQPQDKSETETESLTEPAKRISSRHELDAAPAALKQHGMAAESGTFRQIPNVRERAHGRPGGDWGDVYFVAVVAGCSVAAISGVVSAGYCFYKFQQQKRAAADVDYPAYGVIGPVAKPAAEQTLQGDNTSVGTGQESSPVLGDRKLAQSAQMYHYHHQKQQMIAAEKKAASTTGTSVDPVRRTGSASDDSDDEDNEEGEYTVYECPGLAPTSEMEVKNPLFQDDVTPVLTPPVNQGIPPSDDKDDDQVTKE